MRAVRRVPPPGWQTHGGLPATTTRLRPLLPLPSPVVLASSIAQNTGLHKAYRRPQNCGARLGSTGAQEPQRKRGAGSAAGVRSPRRALTSGPSDRYAVVPGTWLRVVWHRPPASACCLTPGNGARYTGAGGRTEGSRHSVPRTRPSGALSTDSEQPIGRWTFHHG